MGTAVGKNYPTWIGPIAQLVVIEPYLMKCILNTKDETLPDFGFYIRKLFDDGLVATNGEKWLSNVNWLIMLSMERT